jgi:beta-glucanase (GH16 family)
MEYTPKAVTWYVDDKVVRVLTYEEVGAAEFPQTPMQIKMGTWCGGCKGQPKGTVEWSLGPTNLEDGPFDAIYKSISIIDYAGGSGPTSESVKEYVYGDKSGNWESIKVIKGDGSSSGDDQEESSTSASVKPTKSAEHESHSAKPTKSAEETKSEESTKSAEKTSSVKPASSSSTFVTSSTSSEAATTPAPSTTSTTGEDEANTTPAPSTSAPADAPGAASGLSLGSALAVGAGLLIAQLLL